MWDSLRRRRSEMAGHDDVEVPEHGLRHHQFVLRHVCFEHRHRTIRNTLGLNAERSSGSRKYPFPQAGPQFERLAEEQAQQLDQRLAVERLHQLGEEPSATRRTRSAMAIAR